MKLTIESVTHSPKEYDFSEDDGISEGDAKKKAIDDYLHTVCGIDVINSDAIGAFWITFEGEEKVRHIVRPFVTVEFDIFEGGGEGFKDLAGTNIF